MDDSLSVVMAGLVPAINSPTLTLPQTGEGREGAEDVDARDTSAFTRVFDALCAGMMSQRLRSLVL
jgi:hypothetical protein